MSLLGEEKQSTVVLADVSRNPLLVFQYTLDKFEPTSDPSGIIELRSVEFDTLPDGFQKEIARLKDLTAYIKERCPHARVYLIGSTALDICRGTLNVEKVQDRDILVTNITLAEFFQLFYQLNSKPLLESLETEYENIPITTRISQSGFEIVRPEEAWRQINIRLYIGKDPHYIDMQIPHAFAHPERVSLAEALSVLTNGIFALEITPDSFLVMSPFDNALDLLAAGPLEAPFPYPKEYTLTQGVRDSLSAIEDWVKNSKTRTLSFRTIRQIRELAYKMQGVLDLEYAKRISDEVFERIWRCVELALPQDKKTVLALLKETGLLSTFYPITTAATLGNFQSVVQYLETHGYTQNNFQDALNRAIHPDVLHPPILEGTSINGHNSYLEAVLTDLGFGSEWVTSMEANFALLWAFLNQEITCFKRPVRFLEMLFPIHIESPDGISENQRILIQAHSLYTRLLLPFLTAKVLIDHAVRNLEQVTQIQTYDIPHITEESVRNLLIILLLSNSMEIYISMAALLNKEVEQTLNAKGYPYTTFALKTNGKNGIEWDYLDIPAQIAAQIRAHVYLGYWLKEQKKPYRVKIPNGVEKILQPQIFFWNAK
jgi:hypothetical protein